MWPSAQRAGRLGLEWARALLPLQAPAQVLPFSPPLVPSSITSGSRHLTWSRLGLLLPDVPRPRHTGPRPPPCSPRAFCPPVIRRTWVSGVRVPCPQAPHHCLNPLPHPGAPLRLPASLHPCLGLLTSGLCRRLPFRLHVPLPCRSFLRFADWSLPPFFLLAPPSLAAYGWAGKCPEPAGAWAWGLWEGD